MFRYHRSILLGPVYGNRETAVRPIFLAGRGEDRSFGFGAPAPHFGHTTVSFSKS